MSRSRYLRIMAVLLSLWTAMLACTAPSTAAAEADTRAGTQIVNVASLRIGEGPDARTISSNPVTLTVGERLDVAWRPGAAPQATGDGRTVVAAMLTNAGNGEEAFVLGATASNPARVVERLAVDANGDGAFDPAVDTVLTGSRGPVLTPGQAVSVFAILAPGSDDGSVTLTATAASGSGTPGTGFAGAGDGGGDAVTGSTGGSATIVLPVAAPTALPGLIKSQSVRAPDGSSAATSGAVVTYALEARFPGPMPGAWIADPIPSGAAYVPGSLTLDGLALSDAADADAGEADARGIAVALGDIAAAGSRRVTFQVRIP